MRTRLASTSGTALRMAASRPTLGARSSTSCRCDRSPRKEKLGIGFNETTADGNFTLKEGECMGACGDAPVMIVNNTHMCSFMSNEKLDALIADLQSKAPTNGAGK